MSTAVLTKRVVDKLTPRAKDYIAYDSEIAGFGVRVTRRGKKSWTVEFRSNGGGRRASKARLTLGSTTVLTPAQARKAALDILARVHLGEDVARNKADRRSALTISELSIKYMEQEVCPKRKSGTMSLYKTYFRIHIVPEIGTRKACDLSRADVAKLHLKIGETRPATANRILTLLSGMLTWAVRVGYLPEASRPTSGIKRFPEQARERFLTAEEFGRLGDALREAETTGLPWTVNEVQLTAKHAPKVENRLEKLSPSAVAAVRLLIFTGCRLREILHLRWREVDFERQMLFLADSKTGRKHIFLPPPAIEILGGLKRNGDFVLPGDGGDHPRRDLHRPWKSLCKRAGLEGLRIHDLRHSFAAVGVSNGLGLPILAKLLGHRDTETTNRYAHVGVDPSRIASTMIAEKISAALSSNNR